MPEEPYKKREIDYFMETMKKDLVEFRKDVENRDVIQRAEIQSGFGAVTRRQDVANGRVSKLEKWQFTLMGGLSVLTIIVVPILGWALYILVNIQQTVHQSVDAALTAYDINEH